jgi:uncharacterized protein (UPF0548 family)
MSGRTCREPADDNKPFQQLPFVNPSRLLSTCFSDIAPHLLRSRHSLPCRANCRYRTRPSAWQDRRHFELGWIEVFPTLAAVAPGTVVAVLVRHLGFWSMNGCRVVYEIGGDDSREFGFAYGTLTNHAEIGEEIFKVSLRPGTGEVSYVIRAASRPRALLARLGYPVTRSLQARFRRDSAAAIARAIAG